MSADPAIRVLILSASIGEGHDLPARVLADGLRADASEPHVMVENGLEPLGRIIDFAVRENAEAVVRQAPGLFDLQYQAITRWRRTRELLRAAGYRLGGGRMLRFVTERRPDVVVSTYPGVTEILGELRRRGRLDVPVVSAITDLAALRYWAHPGVDLHLITHRESAFEVDAIAGPGRSRWVKGLTAPEYLTPRDSVEARCALGLPEAGPVVVVSGGGWAVGDLAGAVGTALARPDAFVVCLAGRSEPVRAELEDRFAGEPRVRVLGFTDQMSDLLAASDAIVHSTAGLTVLEALMRGCRPISYGWGVAHVRVNNRAYAHFGIADVVETRPELSAALDRALAAERRPDESFAALPSAAESVLEVALDQAARGGRAAE